MSGGLERRSEVIDLLRQLEEADALTPTSLSLGSRPNLTFDQFEAIGVFLDRVHDGTKFWVADWFLEGEARYGDDVYQAAAKLKRSERTLMNWVWVARNVPRARRRAALPFTSHYLVASLEPAEQVAWLNRAEDENLTSTALRDALESSRALDEPESVHAKHERADRDDSIDCDAILAELVEHVREQLRVCGWDREAVLEVGFGEAILRPFPSAELRIERGPS